LQAPTTLPRPPTRAAARSESSLALSSPTSSAEENPTDDGGQVGRNADGSKEQRVREQLQQQREDLEREKEEKEIQMREREEELKRRQQEQERLAPFAPKLLYTDSFYAFQKKEEEESLEQVGDLYFLQYFILFYNSFLFSLLFCLQLRQWREEERRKAIEKERQKAAKVVNVDELNVRPEGGARLLRRSVKEQQDTKVREGKETLRREGVLLVRAIDEFKGKMLLAPPDKEKIAGKSKRKQLKFKLNDVIRVSSGTRTHSIPCTRAHTFGGVVRAYAL
jgi:hypothetical protein